MSLKFCTVQMLTPNLVVPFVEGNAMVINHPGGIDLPLEMFILLALIELELQCLRVSIVYL